MQSIKCNNHFIKQLGNAYYVPSIASDDENAKMNETLFLA